MSTPTPTVRTCGELSCEECNARTAALIAERDQLRVDLELADVMYQRECEVEHELRTEVERLRSDRDCEKRLRKDADEFRENAIARAERAEAESVQLRADRTYNHECINRLASATGTLGEKSEKVVDVVLSTIDQLRAENVTLRGAQKACEACDEPTAFEVRQLRARAERAEDNLAALEQCHDDNCRGVVKIADDLAAERARLNWVFHNCKVTSDDFTVHDREDLGVAMKEDAK